LCLSSLDASMLNRAWAEAAAGGWVVVPGREGVERDAEQALW